MYNQKVLKYFQKAKNMGKLKNPDGIGKVGNIACGDVMWVYIKVKAALSKADPRKTAPDQVAAPHQAAAQDLLDQYLIAEIKFETFGCVAAIASSTMITELAKGKTLSQALKINRADVVDSLGGLPPVKIHCSVLAADALAEAVYDYLLKQKQVVPDYLQKRHQRLEKEKQLIAEKFHHWTAKK